MITELSVKFTFAYYSASSTLLREKKLRRFRKIGKKQLGPEWMEPLRVVANSFCGALYVLNIFSFA